MTYLLLVVAALAAGAINSVAGGGTLLTFPALLWAGVSPITANATSTVALVPGSFGAFMGYRRELDGSASHMGWIGIPSLIGGGLGALCLMRAGDALFGRLAPWLILLATGLFFFQEPIRRWTTTNHTGDPSMGHPLVRSASVAALQLLIAWYGGFFGAGIGILMLATFQLLGLQSIHRMNGLKTFAAICVNGVASVAFIFQSRVVWHLAVMMAVGAIVGGYGGAGIARHIGQANVRRFVMVAGMSIATWMLVKSCH